MNFELPHPRLRFLRSRVFLFGVVIVLLAFGGFFYTRWSTARHEQRLTTLIKKIEAAGGTVTRGEIQYGGTWRTDVETWIENHITGVKEGVSQIQALADSLRLTEEDIKIIGDCRKLNLLYVKNFPPGAVRHLHNPNLVLLCISDSKLTRDDFRCLGRKRVENLWLVNVPVPDDDIALIAKNPRIVSLGLIGAELSDAAIAHLDNMKQLASLDIESPLTDKGLENLTDLTGLTRLALSGATITDTGLAHIKKLDNLVNLELKKSAITDEGLRHLVSLKNLEWLSLGETPVTGTGLNYLGALPKLQDLDVTGTAVDDSSILNLPSSMTLRSIILDNTRISDAALDHLRQFSGLQLFSLRKTRVTDEGIKKLKSMTGLSQLILTDTAITGAGVEALTGLPSIDHLDLAGTRVDDAALAHVSALPALRYLVLSKTKITDEGLAHLTNLRQLYSITLEQTLITDKGVRLLGTLPALNRVSLTQTPITDACVEDLKKLKLNSLNIGKTAISKEKIAELRAAFPNATITHGP